MDDQCNYNTYTCFIYNQLWFIDHPKNTLSYSIFHNLKLFKYLTTSIQFCNSISVLSISSVMQIKSVMPISSVMPLKNLTYVFDIQDIRVTGTVPLGCRPVSHGFITQYGPAGLLTGYKQSNSEHYRYGPAGLLIGVTHQINSSQYCYLTLLVYQSILNTN